MNSTDYTESTMNSTDDGNELSLGAISGIVGGGIIIIIIGVGLSLIVIFMFRKKKKAELVGT